MNAIKMSSFLTRAVMFSKTFGNKPNPPFTAERFILAITEMSGKSADVDRCDELITSVALLKSVTDDYGGLKQRLTEYICHPNNNSLLDDLYMKKRLNDAVSVAESRGAKEVTAVTLLECIVCEPSEIIKSSMIAEPAEGYDNFDETAELLYEEELEQEYESGSKHELSRLVSDINRIKKELSEKVFGQDNGINVFATGYFQASLLSLIDKKRTRPKATFLFAGPPGVGKTFMAEKAAEALGLPFMRFDMSEYADKESNIEFCGSDKVYKNGKPGNVTGFVSEHPSCVLLFDEIEKASIGVIHLFLQMLDAGRLRDNYTDIEVSFSDTIIILTTNAGKQLYESSESGNLASVSRKVIIKALQTDKNPATGAPYFPAAICSRFASGNVVMFNHIGANELRTIAKREITRHGENLKDETGIELSLDEKVYTALLFSEGASVDARTIRARAEAFFNDELYELLRLVASDKVKTGIEDIERIKVTASLAGAEKDVLSLFEAEKSQKLLVFADTSVSALCGKKLSGFEVFATNEYKTAAEYIKNNEISLVLLDMKCGLPERKYFGLNIEDAQTPARDLFRFIKEQRELPVYLLEGKGTRLSDEEKSSFIRQGVRGILNYSSMGFGKQASEIACGLYQQASMVKLAASNKLVSFETAQSVSKNGKQAEITLFDFKMLVAVDSEDSKNVLSPVSTPKVRFEDVIGADDAKKELTYFVEYLREPKKYLGTGVKAPKGVLLYGPPGTGKTMLAKAMARESGVTFIATEGNQFLKKYVGEGPEKVHELFKTARKYAPSILFVDEIDAIAKERRGGKDSGISEETLTAFLTEMDGFVNDASKPVFVLAATNFDVEPGGDRSLDPALMRRFDRRVYIELPNKDERIRFLKTKFGKNPAFDISEAQTENIAVRSVGMSLAELDSAAELALRSAIRENSTKVTDRILEDAFETFNNGEAKKWDVSQLERVARHESGHAFICHMTGGTPSYLTVVARGEHGGYMLSADKEDKKIFTKDELLGRIKTALGGRAAEMVYYGERDGISTGASGDLEHATALARHIVCTYGMDENLGLAVVSEAVMSPEVKAAVNRILREQMEQALALISENKDKINALVDALMSKNYLNGAEIQKVLASPEKNKITV